MCARSFYWLAKEGVHVALLERTALAEGATGRNGGFMVAGPAGSYSKAVADLGHETAQAVLNVTCESRLVLQQVLQEEAIACDYREPGTIRLALTEAQVKQLTQDVEALRVSGLSAQ